MMFCVNVPVLSEKNKTQLPQFVHQIYRAHRRPNLFPLPRQRHVGFDHVHHLIVVPHQDPLHNSGHSQLHQQRNGDHLGQANKEQGTGLKEQARRRVRRVRGVERLQPSVGQIVTARDDARPNATQHQHDH